MWIVIEGVDGAGKSTLADRLALDLAPVVRVREPGGTPFGEWVRAVTKGREAPYAPPSSEHGRRVFERMRAEHPWLRELPALRGLAAEDEVVLFLIARADVYGAVTCAADRVVQDRGMLSTYAYQAHEPRVGAMLDRWAPLVWPTSPSLTLLLDVAPETSLARVGTRGEAATDRFERRGIEYFRRVRDAYASAARSNDVVVLDASSSPDEVHRAALEIVLDRDRARGTR